jgi:hypothetical protein
MAIIKIEPYIIDTTGDFTFNNVTATGNLSSLNANLGNTATANFFSGSGNNLSNISGSNVSGQVGNALVSSTVYTNAQPNITSVGTLTGITSTGTVNLTGASNVALGPVANVHITGGTNGQYLQTDGSGTLSWSTVSTGAASNISNGNSNVNIPSANGNINFTAVGNTVMIITGTGVNVAGTLNTGSGIITGNGNGLSSIVGANVTGQVGNSLVSGTVYTNAQPNITSVGTLTELSVSGNGVFGGNLTVNGTLTYINSTTLSISDPIINLQTGPNGAAPVANTGKDVGTALNYYDTSAKISWMGWDVSNAEIAFGSNVGISSEVVTFTELANIRSGNASLGNAATANFFIGSGNNLSNISGSNVSGTVANATYALSAGTAGTVTTNAQPNITSVGTLTSLSSSGNITGANLIVTGYHIRSVGTGITAAGTTQGGGTALTKEINIVSTVASGATGVVLPTAVAGMIVTITNTTANSMIVYPASGAQINSLGTNAGFSQGTTTIQFVAPTTTQWYTVGATYA